MVFGLDLHGEWTEEHLVQCVGSSWGVRRALAVGILRSLCLRVCYLSTIFQQAKEISGGPERFELWFEVPVFVFNSGIQSLKSTVSVIVGTILTLRNFSENPQEL